MRDYFSQLASSDYFFYYQQNDLENQCASDLVNCIVQPKKSMYFNRRSGAGVGAFRNYPIGFMLQIGISYNIADAVAYRNSVVTDGTNGADRRIAVSQNSITIDSNDNGEVDITVLYYLFKNTEKAYNIKMNTGILT